MPRPETLNPEQFLGLRFECESQLNRLGLDWKSPRVKDFCVRVTGLQDAILADLPELAIASLLTKLKKEQGIED